MLCWLVAERPLGGPRSVVGTGAHVRLYVGVDVDPAVEHPFAVLDERDALAEVAVLRECRLGRVEDLRHLPWCCERRTPRDDMQG